MNFRSVGLEGVSDTQRGVQLQVRRVQLQLLYRRCLQCTKEVVDFLVCLKFTWIFKVSRCIYSTANRMLAFVTVMWNGLNYRHILFNI